MTSLFKRTAAATSMGRMINGESPSVPEMIDLDRIVRTSDLQVRVEVNQGWVDKLATQMKNGIQMEPITVVRIDGEDGLFLVKGFHRVAAAENTGDNEILAIIVSGTWDTAVEMALESNDRHGLPLTTADRRRKIVLAFDHFGWDASNNLIARHTKTYPKLVAGVRSDHEGQDTDRAQDTLGDDQDVPNGAHDVLPDAEKTDDTPASPPPQPARKTVTVRRGDSTYKAAVAAPFAKGKDLISPTRDYVANFGGNQRETLAEIVQGKNACDDHIENMRVDNLMPDKLRVRKASVISAAKKILADGKYVKIDLEIWKEILTVLAAADEVLYEKAKVI